MPVLKFLNKKSHGTRPLAGYCWGVSGIGFLDPRNGNRNHFPGIENCIHDIWDGNMSEKFRYRFMGCSTKILPIYLLSGNSGGFSCPDTVRFPLIADRRSVIVELKVKLIVIINTVHFPLMKRDSKNVAVEPEVILFDKQIIQKKYLWLRNRR